MADMKVLAVIVAHPLRKVAGATRAGKALSVAISEVMPLDLAIMWDQDEFVREGRLDIHYVRSTNPLQALGARLPRGALVPLYDSAIPEMIEGGDYDLVHIHNVLPAFAAERIAKACQKRGIPYVLSTHGFNEQSRYSEINGFRGPKKWLADFAIVRPFERVVRGAAGIFALSDCEDDLLVELGVDLSTVRVVTNGVDEFYLERATEEEIERTRAEFGLNDGRPVVFYMASLHPYKGLDVFLRALQEIRQPFRAVVGGRFRSEREKQALLDGARMAPELKQEIVFTGGVSDTTLRALYQLADVFVYPTKADTFGLVALEAMASGLPVVATPVGGLPYMISENEGIMVPVDDAGETAAAVNRLLADPQLRRRLGENARDRVEREFRWSKVAVEAVAGYEAVLAAEARKPRPRGTKAGVAS